MDRYDRGTTPSPAMPPGSALSGSWYTLTPRTAGAGGGGGEPTTATSRYRPASATATAVSSTAVTGRLVSRNCDSTYRTNNTSRASAASRNESSGRSKSRKSPSPASSGLLGGSSSSSAGKANTKSPVRASGCSPAAKGSPDPSLLASGGSRLSPAARRSPKFPAVGANRPAAAPKRSTTMQVNKGVPAALSFRLRNTHTSIPPVDNRASKRFASPAARGQMAAAGAGGVGPLGLTLGAMPRRTSPPLGGSSHIAAPPTGGNSANASLLINPLGGSGMLSLSGKSVSHAPPSPHAVGRARCSNSHSGTPNTPLSRPHSEDTPSRRVKGTPPSRRGGGRAGGDTPQSNSSLFLHKASTFDSSVAKDTGGRVDYAIHNDDNGQEGSHHFGRSRSSSPGSADPSRIHATAPPPLSLPRVDDHDFMLGATVLDRQEESFRERSPLVSSGGPNACREQSLGIRPNTNRSHTASRSGSHGGGGGNANTSTAASDVHRGGSDSMGLAHPQTPPWPQSSFPFGGYGGDSRMNSDSRTLPAGPHPSLPSSHELSASFPQLETATTASLTAVASGGAHSAHLDPHCASTGGTLTPGRGAPGAFVSPRVRVGKAIPPPPPPPPPSATLRSGSANTGTGPVSALDSPLPPPKEEPPAERPAPETARTARVVVKAPPRRFSRANTAMPAAAAVAVPSLLDITPVPAPPPPLLPPRVAGPPQPEPVTPRWTCPPVQNVPHDVNTASVSAGTSAELPAQHVQVVPARQRLELASPRLALPSRKAPARAVAKAGPEPVMAEPRNKSPSVRQPSAAARKASKSASRSAGAAVKAPSEGKPAKEKTTKKTKSKSSGSTKSKGTSKWAFTQADPTPPLRHSPFPESPQRGRATLPPPREDSSLAPSVRGTNANSLLNSLRPSVYSDAAAGDSILSMPFPRNESIGELYSPPPASPSPALYSLSPATTRCSSPLPEQSPPPPRPLRPAPRAAAGAVIVVAPPPRKAAPPLPTLLPPAPVRAVSPLAPRMRERPRLTAAPAPLTAVVVVAAPPPPPRARAASPVPPRGRPLLVTGVAHGVDINTGAWRTDPVQFTVLDPDHYVGKDDMFIYYAAELPAALRSALAAAKRTSGATTTTAASSATVKVFRPDVMGVTSEADYFAQGECHAVEESIAVAWGARMARSGRPATDPYRLPTVLPFLQTRRTLVRLDAASVAAGLSACRSERDSTGDLSIFGRTTDSTNTLLCIVEPGVFCGFPMGGAETLASPRLQQQQQRSPATAAAMDPLRLAQLSVAMAHLSHAESDGALVLSGLREGCCRAAPPAASANGFPFTAGLSSLEPSLVLTDPLVHSTLRFPPARGRPRVPFGRTNGGSVSVEQFCRAHVCNDFCAALGLDRVKRPLPYPQSVAAAAKPPPVPTATTATKAGALVSLVEKMHTRLPVQVLVSQPGSTPGTPIYPPPPPSKAAAPSSSVVEVRGGVLYCFDAVDSARWQPAKVSVRLDLSETGAAVVAADRFVSFTVQVRSEESAGQDGANGAAAARGPRPFVRMVAHVFPVSVAAEKRNDASYFAAAGEDTLLAQLVADYNAALRRTSAQSTTRAHAQPISVARSGLVRINRYKLRGTIAASGYVDDGRSSNILDFYSTDSRDVLLLVRPVDDAGIDFLEHTCEGVGEATTTAAAATHGPRTPRQLQQQHANGAHADPAACAAGAAAPGFSAETVAATRKAFEAFCKARCGDLVELGEYKLASLLPGAAEEAMTAVAASGARKGTTKAVPVSSADDHGGSILYVDVRRMTVHRHTAARSGVDDAAASRSPIPVALRDRICFMILRIDQFHVYTALKYVFNFYKLLWQPVETFMSIPTPNKGIGAGTFRVCFEALELPRRRRVLERRHTGYNIQHDLAGLSAQSYGLDAPTTATPEPRTFSRTASGVATHSPFASPSMPKLELSLASPPPGGGLLSRNININTNSNGGTHNLGLSGPRTPPPPQPPAGAGCTPSLPGGWVMNVAKMFKRHSTFGAGLPITERNYFFEAAKQNYSACIARDFTHRLSSAAVHRGSSSALAALAAPQYPQLWFIPASVVTLRYDLDLPLHLCHERKGFFSYRCTEMHKHRPELFEEAGNASFSSCDSDADSPRKNTKRTPRKSQKGAPSLANIRRNAAGGAVRHHPHCMTFSLEPNLPGHFSKYMNNNGGVFYSNEETLPVAEEEARRCIVRSADALAHFSWEESAGGLLLCDLQGVGTALTDPEIHTIEDAETDARDVDRAGYDSLLALGGSLPEREDSNYIFEQTTAFLAGNGGKDGIEAFVRKHKCTDVCEAAGLSPVQGGFRVVRARRPGAGADTPPPGRSYAAKDRSRNRYMLILKGAQMAAEML